MRALSAELTNHILSLLEFGHSTYHTLSSTGVHHTTIIRLHSKHLLDHYKFCKGPPQNLSPIDIHHAFQLIGSGKAEMLSGWQKHFRILRSYLSLHQKSGIT